MNKTIIILSLCIILTSASPSLYNFINKLLGIEVGGTTETVLASCFTD